MSTIVRWSTTGICFLALAGVSPAVAHATPPSGVTAETLGHVSFPFLPGSAAIAGTDFTARKITIAPGGTTGWHYHDGPVYAYVETGVLTRTLHDCSQVSTPAGQIVAEEIDANHVHEGTNLGTVPVVLYAAYIEPPGKPFAEDAPAPPCAATAE
ncbi:cupin domain-containing protein [Rhodococcus sp. G-MC3]|uniref:cupin domain-containing protein n=1 Tax=Rhodococcus sp. G-MC3 TaxID=3046209 RepID=UPI0024BB8D17|nr:cupin domain-containing protein [Rhodococcus sp. G-MC3]MDJ0392965.1 cupin domain-containing protein [Rhodococcus sp. G-MC3]